VDYQKLLIEQLELIDRVVHFIGRRHHLSAADVEEFTSVVRFKLIDRDFAILRKFEGRSNLSTYLTTVIERLYLDFCIARWGKWRPSAVARRLGGVAVQLERLLGRDGLTFDEAVGTLQTNFGVQMAREDLRELMLQLPVRTARKFAGEEELAAAASTAGVIDVAFDHQNDTGTVDRVETLLSAALRRLPAQDQLLLKLRFEDNLAVTRIARAFGEDPKPLYARLDQVLVELRDELRKGGIEQTDIDRIVGHPALTLGRLFAPGEARPSEDAGTRPSKG
jgi:RNA polymerase sigma factor (sigma-70 family)